MLLLFGIGSNLALAQVNYSTYENGRFGYSIKYPTSLLKMQPPPDNGDGRIFLSTKRDVEMRVWGQHNALFRSLDDEFDAALRNYGNSVSYKRKTVSSFVVSGIRDGKVYYQKTVYHKFKTTDVFITFTVEYPLNERRTYDAIVERVSRSFRFNSKVDV